MVEAAAGELAVYGRAVEKVYPGLPAGPMSFLDFDSVAIGRQDTENPSPAITGSEGMDRGTPGAPKFEGADKKTLTPNRFLEDVVGMLSQPYSCTALGGPVTAAAAGTPGTGYTLGDPITFTGGGGTGATAHVGTINGGGGVLTIVIDDGGKDYTSAPTPVFSAGTGTGAAGTATISNRAWEVILRPDRANPLRTLSLFLHEGGGYRGTLQGGRRTEEIDISDDADKPVKLSTKYSDPTGETVYGSGAGTLIAKSTNAGTWTGKIVTRGRALFPTGKSLFLKVTAKTATAVTFVTKYDTASGHTDGTSFPAGAFGAAAVVVSTPATAATAGSTDSFVVLVDETGAKITGSTDAEGGEYLEIAAQGDFTAFAVNDQFEIVAEMQTLTKTEIPETRLSSFHLVKSLLTPATKSIEIKSGTTKISRPWESYNVNGRILPSNIDRKKGSVFGVTTSFKRRLFETFFRQKAEQHGRFSILNRWLATVPIPGTSVVESVEQYLPQNAVTGYKGGEVSARGTLEEDVTMMAEQPSVADISTKPIWATGNYVAEFRIVTAIDPTSSTGTGFGD